MSSQVKSLREASPKWLNEMRIRRMETWLKLAKQQNAPDHVRFVFYWIAFEAAYVCLPEDWSFSQDMTKDRSVFLDNVCSLGNSALRKVLIKHQKTAANLFTLRWATAYFWYRNDWKRINPEVLKLNSAAQEDEWESRFKNRCKYRLQKLDAAVNTGDEKAVRDTLASLFKVLAFVRNQIVHGGSAGGQSLGKSQVEWGVELLDGLIPKLRDIIRTNMQANWWGVPAFPRLFPDIVRDQDHPPPWLLKGNRNIKTRRRR